LAIAKRIANKVAEETIVHPTTGEVLVEAGQVITREVSEIIQNAGINEVKLTIDQRTFKVVGNNFVWLDQFLKDYDPDLAAQFAQSGMEMHERVHLPVLLELISRQKEDGTPFIQLLEENKQRMAPK
ncbi:MAG: hypothetical protein RR843_12455, partial [Clostridia bacterium]